ncbi:hypothetical protein [Oceanithermus desulfurans]|uniref:Lipoprotein n=2 Tax=Oceanithermus desulfurans TaxID=227924 RepID=A0A511RNJ2_9DEIN|nr:hypothetical protein [Oceanithermus desulfurans]MBB6029921.1 hypothetical protein [Oceanithermus desulfurans]GEM90667.1 hypothetical protein ODE01S_21010 [Oceanithermus desulfurans NBRC 100063]
MKRLPLLSLLALGALLLGACQQQEDNPAPVKLTWTQVLITPYKMALDQYDTNGDYLFAAVEETPLDGDASKNYFSLWRVDGDGTVLGPQPFPDPSLVTELAAQGESCPAPQNPQLAVSPTGEAFVAAALRNGAAQAEGCDTTGVWPAWSGLARYDVNLNRQAFALLKAFDGTDPYYTEVITGAVKGDGLFDGYYRPDYRLVTNYNFYARLAADGTLTATRRPDPEDFATRLAHATPDGGRVEVQGALDRFTAGWGERLVRYDAAGNAVWSVVTTTAFSPTMYLVPADGDVLFVSGYLDEDADYLGVPVPNPGSEKRHFVARLDGGQLSWLRWISDEEERMVHSSGFAYVPIAYDAAQDELYAAAWQYLMALDPATGATRWIVNLPEITSGSPTGVTEWDIKYQPQSFEELFVVDGGLLAVLPSIWDTDAYGQPTPTTRYRPLVLRFDRR